MLDIGRKLMLSQPNGLPKQVVLKPRESVTLSLHYQHFMKIERSIVMLMLMNLTMHHVAMT